MSSGEMTCMVCGEEIEVRETDPLTYWCKGCRRSCPPSQIFVTATLAVPVSVEFLRRVVVATKHGPVGSGRTGPCDAACVKCEAELMLRLREG